MSFRTSSLRASAVVAGLLVLTACGGDATETATPPAAPVTTPAAPGTSPVSPTASPSSSTPKAPAASTVQLAGQTVSGGTFDAAQRLAGKPAVLWFWAPWCTVCRGEAPTVAKIAQELEGKVEFVGVAGRGPVKDMQRFVSDTKTQGFEHVVDDDGSRWSRFKVAYQPAFVFVDAQGRTQLVPGAMSEGKLREATAKLLAG